MDDAGRLVRVGVAANQAEAEMLAELLRDAGIESLVLRTGGADVPDFLAAGPRRIMVPESRAERAREVLGTEAAPEPAAEQVDPARLLAWVLAGTLIVILIAVAAFLFTGG